MLEAAHIVTLQQAATARWHEPYASDSEEPSLPVTANFDRLVLEQHRANFDLWHHEDAARDPNASDRAIVEHKHAIDALNQRRNDLAEQMDSILLAAAPRQDEKAPLHSETPGMMIDRLSILALKRFHTEEETRRAGAESGHHVRNWERLAILDAQLADLAGCLERLWQEVGSGRRRFKLYRQMKMYNDPALNPVLYRESGSASDSVAI